MRVSDYNENMANMAAVGMFGFEHFDLVEEKTFAPPEGLTISSVQAFENTVIKNVEPTDGTVVRIPESGFEVPEGTTIMVNAVQIDIVSGSGLIYYGG